MSWLRDPPALLRALDRLDSEQGLAGFIRRAWPVIEPAAPYSHGWHIDAVAEHLEAITAGQITRLLINVPPGTMKSLAAGVFWPAWEWGPRGRPALRTVAVSHALRLAVRDNLRARRLVTSDWYRALWGERVQLMPDQNSKQRFETRATGLREAVSAGSITGSRGDRLILDDPISVEGANSERVRETVNRWFLEAVPTRLNDPAHSAIVVIMQRLHERDVAGTILARDLGYEHLMLPMEFEPERACVTGIGFRDPRREAGELLFPARFPRATVERDKAAMGAYAAAGQFQQRPAPREGGLFKRAWFGRVGAAPAGCRWVRAWDLAASVPRPGSEPAYTAGAKLGRAPDGHLYLADMRRDRLSPGGVERLILATAAEDGPECRVFLPQDPGQAGKAQAQYLVRRLAGYDARATPESGDKATRAQPVSAQAEAGNLHLVAGPWNDAFLDEAALFPNGAFLDQIDALSRAFSALAVPGYGMLGVL
ncbi:phage terminase large subunit [uncultured Methylobacterium sp.]|jgi:predicted phage terminase large subunit-like protein|uniref:phage terminase large subunit n=1 Tax=uncultured Methylobacterium sp. TaxID=157278 RepID=UPI00263074C8|nr:phage terminase large subunit [uncultured Methylobacterium sp.]